VGPILAHIVPSLRTLLFERRAALDSEQFHKYCMDVDDGLHWYFRALVLPMRDRLAELSELSTVPRVLLHGNAHIDNYSKLGDSWAGLFDFDHACGGPYTWDIVRFLVSVSLKENDFSTPFIKWGVLENFRTGYLDGLLKSDPSPDNSNSPPFAEDWFEAEVSSPEHFLKKRIREMEAHPLDPEGQEVNVLLDSYRSQKCFETSDFLRQAKVLQAGLTQNWNGRERILLLLRSAEKDLLFDFRPVFQDPENSNFSKFDRSSNVSDMIVASHIYAPKVGEHEAVFTYKGVEWFGREIPMKKSKLQKRLTEDQLRAFVNSCGYQLGQGIARLAASMPAYAHFKSSIMLHISLHWEELIGVAQQLRNELASAHKRYLSQIIPPGA